MSEEGRDRLLTRPFVLVFGASLTQAVAFNLFLHLPGFLSDLGASEARIGWISGVMAIAAILARSPIGRTMDGRGRRPVILLGGVLHTVACAAYLLVGDLGPLIYAIRILHGLAEAMLFTALFTLAADHVPASRRTQGLALFGVSGMLPMALGGLLGDLILARSDYAALFGAATGFAAVSLALSLPLHDVPRSGAQAEPSGGLAAAFRQPDLLPLWWIGGIFATALAAVFVFLKRYVDATGLATVGGFFSAYSLTAILLRVGFGWLPDRVGPKRVLFPALASLAVAFALIATARSGTEVVLAGVLFGLGHGMTFPILFGILVTRARESERGSAMAIFTALFDVGVLVGGPAFGWIIDRAGYAAMYGTAALAVVAGAAVFAVWDRRPGGAERREA